MQQGNIHSCAGQGYREDHCNSGAHLTDLVRKRIGDFHVENALNIEEFERNLVFL